MSKISKTIFYGIKKRTIWARYSPLLIALSLVAYSSPIQAEGYTYQIFDPFGVGQVQALGLDDTGNVTGAIGGVDNDDIGVILNIRSGELTLVPEIRALFDLNNQGDGVGVVTGNDGASVCALRDKSGVITTFTPPSIQNGILTDCSSRGRNALGEVSGFEFGGNGWIGFLHDPRTGAFEEFLPTARNEQTIVGQINARGELAGGVRYRTADQVYPGSPPGVYGFRRNADGSMKFFTINGSTATRARGISDSGVMAGWFVPGDLFKAYVADVSAGAGFEDISIPDDQVLVPESCVPVTIPPPFPPEPGQVWAVEISSVAGAIGNNGTVIGGCSSFWILRDSAGGFVAWLPLGSASFIATPN